MLLDICAVITAAGIVILVVIFIIHHNDMRKINDAMTAVQEIAKNTRKP